MMMGVHPEMPHAGNEVVQDGPDQAQREAEMVLELSACTSFILFHFLTELQPYLFCQPNNILEFLPRR